MGCVGERVVEGEEDGAVEVEVGILCAEMLPGGGVGVSRRES